MNIEAIIFDMDGVLIDSGEAHKESWRMLARELGAEISDERFAGLFGRSSRDIIRALYGDNLPDKTVAQYDDRKERAFRELVRGRMPAMRGAVPLVRSLFDRGFSLAVGSSGPPENIQLCLQDMAIARFFSAVVTGMDVVNGKPDPQVFLLAADRLGADPKRCVVVEDAPAGVEAARRAGMKCIALVGSHPPAKLQYADRVVTALDDITPENIQSL